MDAATLEKNMIQPGSTVRFAKMPAWIPDLPEDSQRVFSFCLGKKFVVTEMDSHGLFVLDVSGDVDRVFGGISNDLRLEAEYLEEVL